MLRTPLCDLMGMQVPVIQASLGPFTSVELSAAVSNAGGLGSLGAAARTADQLRESLARMRDLTDRPFAVNFTMRPFDPEAFAMALAARPAVISLAHGDPGDLVRQAHDAGCLFMHMVTTVQQARDAAGRGVDVIIAQGGESAGFGGTVSAMALVPQVVDAVSPVPVVASGGIADGRGLAAALVLGAQGVNIGTRFLASTEATVAEEWKRSIVAAESEDAVKLDFMDELLPPPGSGAYAGLSPRTLRTPFVDRWNGHPDQVREQAPRLGQEFMEAVRQGRGYEYTPFTGQTAGLIHQVLPVAEIIGGLMAGAEEALRRSMALVDAGR